jgi:hypothetical protein
MSTTSPVVTFISRAPATTLGEFAGGVLGDALNAGRTKAAEDRKEAMSLVAPMIQRALGDAQNQAAAASAALQEQLLAVQAPLEGIQRALAYARADENNPVHWLPLLVACRLVSAADAAAAGYSAVEFAKFSTVPKDWKPSVSAT